MHKGWFFGVKLVLHYTFGVLRLCGYALISRDAKSQFFF